MANYKLVLGDDIKDEFTLIAIHCTVEAYKMAYLINNHLALQLHRLREDLEFSKVNVEITFPQFEFEDNNEYITYNLLANKCKTISAGTVASGELFEEESSEEFVTHYVLPELKTVDFLLKITSDYKQVSLRKLLLDINEINEVISAYNIETNTLRSKNNLIFDKCQTKKERRSLPPLGRQHQTRRH